MRVDLPCCVRVSYTLEVSCVPLRFKAQPALSSSMLILQGREAMIEALLAGGLSLVGGWAGAYFGAYLKKKGENLATHEDIDKLVDQVRAVTQTTKEIEAKISSDVWTMQKQWEMKQEVLFDAAKRIVELDNGLL